ncbi:hypothetical protein Skr01_36600 [Sphaerisporangium krabiense]|nr:hypothetical protein Skr01_36600 [Sphaerisporangium krabiense]
MGSQDRSIGACACCGTEGALIARGLDRACYMRHRAAGTLEQFPRVRLGVGAPHLRRIVECVCCGTEGPHRGRGLIGVCYYRHRVAGTLEQFPRDPSSLLEAQRRGLETRRRAYEYRVQDFAELLSWGESVEEAAKRLGISESTARKYERALKAAS